MLQKSSLVAIAIAISASTARGAEGLKMNFSTSQFREIAMRGKEQTILTMPLLGAQVRGLPESPSHALASPPRALQSLPSQVQLPTETQIDNDAALARQLQAEVAPSGASDVATVVDAFESGKKQGIRYNLRRDEMLRVGIRYNLPPIEYYVNFVIRMMEANDLDYTEAQRMAHVAQSANLSYDDISLVEDIMTGAVIDLPGNAGSDNTVINSQGFLNTLHRLESAMAIVEHQSLALELSDISQAWKQLKVKGHEPQSWNQLIEVAQAIRMSLVRPAGTQVVQDNSGRPTGTLASWGRALLKPAFLLQRRNPFYRRARVGVAERPPPALVGTA